MIFWSLVAVAAVGFGLLIWGARLPRSSHTSRDILVNAPAGLIWSVLTDYLRHVEWRSDLLSVEMAGVTPGQEEWLERPARGRPSLMRITRQKAGQLLEIERLPNGFCAGTSALSLEGAAQATRVTLTETFQIPNPLARVYARLLLDRGAVLERYLHDLKDRAEMLRT